MSYRIVVPVEGSGGFINGVTVDAWKVSRFANANVPAKDSSPPSGSPDAGPVTTATNGAPGQAILDVTVGFVYNIRVQQGGNAYWTQTSEALGGLATTALQSFQGRTTTAATMTKADVTGTGLTYSDVGADASGAAATVQGNLNTEASTRASADTTLQTNINTEASTRASADTTNATAISTEATTRGNADTTLQANIDAEAASRVAGDALAVKKASNLSDLASASTARANLGLGDAATHPASDFSGSAAGTAGKPLAATDASVTNARTPSAHASTHGQGGIDALTTIPPAVTGTTQTAGDNSTKIATTSYSDLPSYPGPTPYYDLTSSIYGGSVGGYWDTAFQNVLNKMGLAPITNVTSNGTTVTYTAANQFSAGNIVTIAGCISSGTAFNLSGVTIATASATQFTVTNAATGTYISGGQAKRNTFRGGTIFIPQGSYSFNKPIRLDNCGSVLVKGNGAPTAGSITNATLIYAGADAQFVNCQNSAGVIFDGVNFLYNNASFVGDLIDLVGANQCGAKNALVSSQGGILTARSLFLVDQGEQPVLENLQLSNAQYGIYGKQAFTATSTGSQSVSTSPVTFNLTAPFTDSTGNYSPPASWYGTVVVSGTTYSIKWTGISGNTLTGVTCSSSITIPTGTTLNCQGWQSVLLADNVHFTGFALASVYNADSAWQFHGCVFEPLSSGGAGSYNHGSGVRGQGLKFESCWFGDVTTGGPQITWSGDGLMLDSSFLGMGQGITFVKIDENACNGVVITNSTFAPSGTANIGIDFGTTYGHTGFAETGNKGLSSAVTPINGVVPPGSIIQTANASPRINGLTATPTLTNLLTERQANMEPGSLVSTGWNPTYSILTSGSAPTAALSTAQSALGSTSVALTTNGTVATSRLQLLRSQTVGDYRAVRVAPNTTYTATIQVRAASNVRSCNLQVINFDSMGTYRVSKEGPYVNDSTSAWTRLTCTFTTGDYSGTSQTATITGVTATYPGASGSLLTFTVNTMALQYAPGQNVTLSGLTGWAAVLNGTTIIVNSGTTTSFTTSTLLVTTSTSGYATPITGLTAGATSNDQFVQLVGIVSSPGSSETHYFDGAGLFGGTVSVTNASYSLSPASAIVQSTSSLPQSQLTVDSTVGFPSSGTLIPLNGLGNATANIINYTSIDATHFYGCTGGLGGVTSGATYFVTPTVSNLFISAPTITANGASPLELDSQGALAVLINGPGAGTGGLKIGDGTGNYPATISGLGVLDCSGLSVTESSNGKQGVATLVAGTVTVANTSVTATSRIFLTAQDGNTVGALRVNARSAGTSFTVVSSNASDTGVVAYEIFEVG